MNSKAGQWLGPAMALGLLFWLPASLAEDGAVAEAGTEATTEVPTEATTEPTSVAGADTLAGRFAEAALVAQVQISGIHRDIDNALSEPGMVAVRGYVYSAVSRRVWKGEVTQLLAFRLGLDACQNKLREGERYIIFASPDTYGRLQLASCEAAVPEVDAASMLAQLDRIAKQG
ncbi:MULTISPECIES: hypothetical protein [Microbulbifer]|nr:MULTISPECIES: hypothetical protein [Microbulbifer]